MGTSGRTRMNRSEHILTCLTEECDETGQRVAKALRFGLTEVQAGQPLSNSHRIVEELRDIIGVVHMLVAEGILAPDWYPTGEMITAKRDKIERFMIIARAQGVLSDDA